MINHATAFILGAGASVNYRLPLGSKLKTDIIGNLSTDRIPTIAQWLKMPEKFIHAFAMQLRNSQSDTIDSWLATNSKYIPLGKICICNCISEYEDGAFVDAGWYQYLWNVMRAGMNCNR